MPSPPPRAACDPPCRVRRTLLAAGLACPVCSVASATPAGADDEPVAALLRAGGVVIAFRHALAPGSFDPEGFRLDDCGTQRNLDDEGRDQARRIGAWFRARALAPARVRSSPWCRCIDTATLAFGHAERWSALGSPRSAGAPDRDPDRARRLAELKLALAAVPAGRFEAWVTHQFLLQDLTGSAVASAEGLVLRAGPADGVELRARAQLFRKP